MIFKKKPNQIHGLWCRANKTFYFLETGHHTVRNPLDRIRSILISRDLLIYDPTGTKFQEEPVKRMTMAQAQERGYKVDCFYLNQHVQEQVEEAKKGRVPTKNPWS